MVYSVMGPMQKIGFTHLLLRVLAFCILQHHAASTDDCIGHVCNVIANYTDRSKFKENMDLVFSTLTKDAPSVGFANTTKGEGSDTVYGLVQCRGDVDQDTCKTCIQTSTFQVLTYCPNTMDASICHEKCQLRYSNTNFFGHLNLDHSGGWSWIGDQADDPDEFYKKLGSLLKNLTSQAITEPSKFMFATGNTPYNDRTIYGLVQCTRDTSLADCKLCLDNTTSQIASQCGGSQGCETVLGSCRVRYDMQLFYGTSTTESAFPASYSPPSSNSSPSPSPPFQSAHRVPNSSLPSNAASNATPDKPNHSRATTVAMVTVITFALPSTWLLIMPSW